MRQRTGLARRLLAVVGLAATAGLAGSAPALVVDDFSAGAFSVQGGVAGATATQTCGSFCLNGTREVFVQSNNALIDATADLVFPAGEAANVMPDGGGVLRFTYDAPPGTSVDLTLNGLGSQLEVWFNAFAPGAEVKVTVEDETAASDSTSATPVLPAPPASVAFALSDLSGVDLQRVVHVEVSVIAPAAGDYHVFLIRVPLPDVVGSDFAVTNPVQSGPPYPTVPIVLDVCHPIAPGDCMPTLRVEFSLVDVPDGMGPLPATLTAGRVPSAESGYVSAGSEVMGVEPEPFREVLRLAYQPPDPVEPPPLDDAPMLDWSPGQDHFEVTVDVLVAGGVQTLTLYGEPDAGQTIGFANVSAAKGGSTLVTVDVDGSGDDPSLHLTLHGRFTPSAAAPTLGPGAFLVLAALLAGIGSAFLRRERATSRGHR